MTIAVTAASTINAEDLGALHIAKDMEKEEYQRVFRKLNEVKAQNENIMWAYILRPTEEKDIWEWVVDADSNFNIPFAGIDYNQDGVIDESDEGVAPGVRYFVKDRKLLTEGLFRPIAENFSEDQWGTFLTASAPIYDEEGNVIAVLAVDQDISDFYEATISRYRPFAFFILATFVVIVIVTICVFLVVGINNGSSFSMMRL